MGDGHERDAGHKHSHGIADHSEAELCICFHVPTRKIVNFCRKQRPQVPSQISQCYGAGTGCGWCVPYLEAIHDEVVLGGPVAEVPDAETYLAMRRAYRADRGLTPRFND